MFFALSFVHEDIIRLVLVFLMVSSFKVIFLSIVFLKVELFFEVDIGHIGTKLDNIVPKLFLFLVSLLDFAYGHI